MGVYKVEGKMKKKDKFFKWIFKFFIYAMIVGTIISVIRMPRETDSFFEIDVDKKESQVVNEKELLFNEPFYWVDEDEKIETAVPGKLSIPAGETVVLESTFPNDYNKSQLIIRSSQQNVKIYIGNRLRVNYDTKDSRSFGSQTTSRYVFCKTGQEDAGQSLRIEITADNQEYSGVINQVYACDKFDFWALIYDKYGTTLLFGIIILCMGLLTICLSIALSIGYKVRFNLEYIGWCILLAGTWLLSESKLRQIIVPNSSILSNIGFIVLMVAPLPALIYMNNVQKRRFEKIYHFIMVLSIANTVISSVLLVADVADYLDTLFVSHIILGLTFVSVIYSLLKEWRTKVIYEYRHISFGVLILVYSVIIEVIAVYFVTMLTGMVLTVGVIVFVIFAILHTISELRTFERKKQVEASLQMIQTLSNTLEAKDEYTRGHSYRVAEYSVIIAKRLGITGEKLEKLHYAATLHDIGKIGVPDTILNKPTRLTDEEYSIIQTHTTLGADLLKKVDLISYTAEVAKHHHERYDGSGYPDGLRGEKIPYLARIVAVADAFDAMNSRRVYRNAMSKEVIRKEIISNRGIQFDPEIADAFIELYDRGAFEIEDPETGELVKDTEAGKLLWMVVETMNNRPSGEDVDYLTGLPMRGKGEEQISKRMKDAPGALIFFDMDNLKKINDVHGHKAGDKALHCLGNVISSIDENGVACRIGGDEFLLFINETDERVIEAKVRVAINEFTRKKDADIMIQEASLSAGICKTETHDHYADVLAKADKALYYVKHRGKDGMHFYSEEKDGTSTSDSTIDIEDLMKGIRMAGNYAGAMDIEYREFTKLYEYIGNLCERYKHTCHLALITLDVKSEENIYIEEFERAMNYMEIAIRENIRNVDICTRYSSVQYLAILLEAGDENVDTIVSRIFARFHKMCNNTLFLPKYEFRAMIDYDDTIAQDE